MRRKTLALATYLNEVMQAKVRRVRQFRHGDTVTQPFLEQVEYGASCLGSKTTGACVSALAPFDKKLCQRTHYVLQLCVGSARRNGYQCLHYDRL